MAVWLWETIIPILDMETLFPLTFIMLILTLAFPIPGSRVTTALQSVCVWLRKGTSPPMWMAYYARVHGCQVEGGLDFSRLPFVHISFWSKKNPAFPHTAVLRKILSKLLGLQSQGLNFVLEEDGNITMPVCTYSDIHWLCLLKEIVQKVFSFEENAL